MNQVRCIRPAMIGLVLLLAVSAPASAATADWEGITWDSYRGTISVNVGNLNVATTGTGACDNSGAGPVCWGVAHYNTPDSLRNDPDHSVSVSFVDAGPGTHGMQIWATKETAPSSWTQFGARDGDTHYYILLLRFDPVFDLHTVELNVQRTPGIHTLTIGKRADTTVDYFIDGDLVYTDTFLELGYIGDVYLGTQSTISNPVTGIFTAYSTSNDYVEPVPQSRLCIAPFTGQVTMLKQCSAQEIQFKLPYQAPLTLCVSYYTGKTRASLYGLCSSGERTIVAQGDKTISGCVNVITHRLRIPLRPGPCSLGEIGVSI